MVKLNRNQRRVLEKLRDGWVLSQDNSSYNINLQRSYNDDTTYIRKRRPISWSDYLFLLEHGLVEECPIVYKINYYDITAKGREVLNATN